jgi:lipopolysaccharide transport system ATP-binding protein
MSDIVISVEGLSKRYMLGHRSAQRENYTVLRDVLARSTRNFARKATDFVRGRQIVHGDEIEEFWALKDVSFEVKRGEVIGIIGRNGAGKSTLLKILSRITEPTAGRVRLRGRVASLLEVGTGFHPELTGRENIYLNGAILGMTRREIRKKFDEIVGFAEVEKFLDTPVKHYSSGMYVRLAFAVAAHLEPEILIVDEVLAVGDAEFQKKCLGKLDDVARREGRTVLFVSHNLAATATLSSRGVLLESGTMVKTGEVADVISSYLSNGTNQTRYLRPSGPKPLTPHISHAEVITTDSSGVQRFGMPLAVKIRVSHQQPLSRGCLSLQIMNQFQQAAVHAFTYHSGAYFGSRPGETVLICRFPQLKLNVGRFHLRTFLSEPSGGELYESLDGICPFEVVRTDESPMWGWRPEACVYHEDWDWERPTVGLVQNDG